jgi:hypothetical protein
LRHGGPEHHPGLEESRHSGGQHHHAGDEGAAFVIEGGEEQIVG